MLDSKPFIIENQAHLHFAADDPVGSLEHSFPVHPDQGSSKPMEYWEEMLHKKRRRKPLPEPLPENPPSDDHQVDDYA